MDYIKKPLLTPQEQVAHLKENGVAFNRITENEAESYLRKNNNYFKLTSYRKNFTKNQEEKYIDLDFAYLIDLATIDMLLRYQLMQMSLDIEHFEKVKLLDIISIKKDNGTKIVESYKEYLSKTKPGETQEDGEFRLRKLDGEIKNNNSSTYCKDLITHYSSFETLPVWVFIEVIPFGRFRDFFEFCANEYKEKRMINDAFCLKSVKSLRNAAGHSNCILNDLTATNSVRYSTNNSVLKELSKFIELKKNDKGHLIDPLEMQNSRIKDIVTLLFIHKGIIPSPKMLEHYRKPLKELFSIRMFRNFDYYENNSTIKNAFTFFDKIINNWYLDKSSEM